MKTNKHIKMTRDRLKITNIYVHQKPLAADQTLHG